jgi:splicing factor 3B subunit 5
VEAVNLNSKASIEVQPLVHGESFHRSDTFPICHLLLLYLLLQFLNFQTRNPSTKLPTKIRDGMSPLPFNVFKNHLMAIKSANGGSSPWRRKLPNQPVSSVLYNNILTPASLQADKLRAQQQLEQLQARYVGTGHADTTKFEWTSNIQRDSYASYVGHPPMLSYMAIGMGECREKVRAQMVEKMIQPVGKPPEVQD